MLSASLFHVVETHDKEDHLLIDENHFPFFRKVERQALPECRLLGTSICTRLGYQMAPLSSHAETETFSCGEFEVSTIAFRSNICLTFILSSRVLYFHIYQGRRISRCGGYETQFLIMPRWGSCGYTRNFDCRTVG
jgi:hypothetical protein